VTNFSAEKYMVLQLLTKSVLLVYLMCMYTEVHVPSASRLCFPTDCKAQVLQRTSTYYEVLMYVFVPAFKSIHLSKTSALFDRSGGTSAGMFNVASELVPAQ
jgi:hypothetical protein